MSLLDNQIVEDNFDENKDYLEELVGDGKKFKDLAALAKGKAHSDHYITQKERQYDALYADYLELKKQSETTAKLQELIDRFENTPKEDTNTSSGNLENQFDPSEIDSLLERKLSEAKVRERREANRKEVESKLIERYGNNYKSALRQQVNSL